MLQSNRRIESDLKNRKKKRSSSSDPGGVASAGQRCQGFFGGQDQNSFGKEFELKRCCGGFG